MEILINDKYDCYESVIATIANSHNLKYWPVFLHDWKFNYNANSLDLKSSNLLLYEDANYLESIKAHIGIEVLHISKQEAYRAESKLLVLSTDAYNCEWTMAHNNYHIKHFFILSEQSDGLYTCIDPFFAVKRKDFILQEFDKSDTNYFSVDLVEPSLDEASIYDFFRTKWRESYYSDNNMFSQMQQLASDFLNESNVLCENQYDEDYVKNPFIRDLLMLGNYRDSLADSLLEFTKVNNSKLSKAAQLMKKSSVSWYVIRFLCIKHIQSSKFKIETINKIHNHIVNIIEFEEEAMKLLLE